MSGAGWNAAGSGGGGLAGSHRESSRPPRRGAGLTLIELMLVVALLAVLGTVLFGFLWQAVDLWETGERGREEAETLAWAMRAVRRDVVAARGVEPPGLAPRAVFLVDEGPFDADGDGQTDGVAPRMRFVRALHPEEFLPRGVGITDTAPGGDPGFVLETLRALPLGGGGGGGEGFRLARRLEPWHAGPFPKPSGEEAGATPSEEGYETIHPGPLLACVFEVAPREGGPMQLVFDSTRGLLDGRDGRSRAPEFLVPASREDPTDDVFPARVRLSLLLPRRSTTRTAEDLGPDGDTVAVVDPVLARRGMARGALVRLGGEWARGTLDGTRLILDPRGLLGSSIPAHPRGTTIRFAKMASMDIAVATRRPPHAAPPASASAKDAP